VDTDTSRTSEFLLRSNPVYPPVDERLLGGLPVFDEQLSDEEVPGVILAAKAGRHELSACVGLDYCNAGMTTALTISRILHQSGKVGKERMVAWHLLHLPDMAKQAMDPFTCKLAHRLTTIEMHVKVKEDIRGVL